ncbi:carboxymuconolactone decarboxylase family protein [Candidatus Protochlamydia phocaeensis]|uniref:carboxymuconolactone decarboxylase family protein n=1 Tax=Candidatus Protochlamydia phocaeensis TaxID=1414722 RepID=UPI000839A13E|nr:peroxidase-related enzyme [Candidatus Protochlamydia phocaeensis]
MARIKPVQPEEAKNEVKDIYKQIEKKMGRIPNIFLSMGNSATALKAYLSLSEAASHTSLEPKVREQLALTISQTNNCQYCLSAHTMLAKGQGLKDPDIIQARHGESQDPKTQAILKFAKTVVENRAQISNQDIAGLKAAGVNDPEIVDIILLITLNTFTNYFNHIADPKIDFPLAPELT